MFKNSVIVWIILMSYMCLWVSITEGAGNPCPVNRIAGTIIVDDVLVTEVTDDGLTITVTLNDANMYNCAGVLAEEIDHQLNSYNYYIVDIPLFEVDNQLTGANPGDIIVIHLFFNGVELEILSPVNGEFVVLNDQEIATVHIIATAIIEAPQTPSNIRIQ